MLKDRVSIIVNYVDETWRDTSNRMTYKDSDQRTKDYLGKFTKDKVVQNLIGTDKP